MNSKEREVVLELKNLRKSYGGSIVLDQVNLQLYRGEILGIMGVSGSGKSTILKLIIGLIMPDSGEIRFKGQDLAQLHERDFFKIRKSIGYVFQNGALFDSLTIEENLRYPLERQSQIPEEEIEKIINDRLNRVGLAGTNDFYPNQLSGGMQKRAGLVRATLLDPEVALIDEPTAGLDPVNIRSFVRRLNEVKKQGHFSGILISHDVDTLLAVCDRIAILWKGNIYAVLPTEKLKGSSDLVIQSFFNTNYKESEAYDEAI
jgi:phospholipid/cholesterol/gamma-HCH transport system ATP-binding protein